MFSRFQEIKALSHLYRKTDIATVRNEAHTYTLANEADWTIIHIKYTWYLWENWVVRWIYDLCFISIQANLIPLCWNRNKIFWNNLFFQVSYSSIRSFDPAVPVAGPPQTVSKLWNSTHHVFSHLHPGTTYQFFLRASTVKGFGPATTINVTTNISGKINK